MTDLAALDDRFYLVGDEDTGVGIRCRDCDDGGRFLAYYDDGATRSPYADDPAVEDVSTISGLLEMAFRHRREMHPSPHKPLDVNALSDEEYAAHRAGLEQSTQAEHRRMLARAPGQRRRTGMMGS